MRILHKNLSLSRNEQIEPSPSSEVLLLYKVSTCDHEVSLKSFKKVFIAPLYTIFSKGFHSIINCLLSIRGFNACYNQLQGFLNDLFFLLFNKHEQQLNKVLRSQLLNKLNLFSFQRTEQRSQEVIIRRGEFYLPQRNELEMQNRAQSLESWAESGGCFEETREQGSSRVEHFENFRNGGLTDWNY